MALAPESMVGYAIVLVIVGVVAAVGAVILGNLGQNSAIANDTEAQQIISNSKGGLTNMTSLLGVVGITIAAVIVIGIVYLVWKQ
jgi:hypothetical protein